MGAAVSTTAAAAADGASKSQQAGSTAVAAAQPPQQQQPAGRTAAAAAPPRPPSGQRCRVRLDLSTPDSPPLQAQPPAPAPAPLAVAAAAQPPGGVCSSELPSLHVDCMRSPVPCAATCFIANDDDADGAVACLVSSHKKQQRRRLSVAIPGGSHEVCERAGSPGSCALCTPCPARAVHGLVPAPSLRAGVRRAAGWLPQHAVCSSSVATGHGHGLTHGRGSQGGACTSHHALVRSAGTPYMHAWQRHALMGLHASRPL